MGRPRLSEVNAVLLMPSYASSDLGQTHSGSMFQRKSASGATPGIEVPAGRVEESREINFPLDTEAHLPQDIREAMRFNFGYEARWSISFRHTRIAARGEMPKCAQKEPRNGGLRFREKRSRFKGNLTFRFWQES